MAVGVSHSFAVQSSTISLAPASGIGRRHSKRDERERARDDPSDPDGPPGCRRVSAVYERRVRERCAT